MDHKTLTGILHRAAEADHFDDLKLVVIDLVTALIQMNRETSTEHDAGVHAALLKFTHGKKRSRLVR